MSVDNIDKLIYGRILRPRICMAALDGLTNEQVGKLGALFEAVRTLSAPNTVDGYMWCINAVDIAARAAGIIKE